MVMHTLAIESFLISWFPSPLSLILKILSLHFLSAANCPPYLQSEVVIFQWQKDKNS